MSIKKFFLNLFSRKKNISPPVQDILDSITYDAIDSSRSTKGGVRTYKIVLIQKSNILIVIEWDTVYKYPIRGSVSKGDYEFRLSKDEIIAIVDCLEDRYLYETRESDTIGRREIGKLFTKVESQNDTK